MHVNVHLRSTQQSTQQIRGHIRSLFAREPETKAKPMPTTTTRFKTNQALKANTSRANKKPFGNICRRHYIDKKRDSERCQFIAHESEINAKPLLTTMTRFKKDQAFGLKLIPQVRTGTQANVDDAKSANFGSSVQRDANSCCSEIDST
jgi:hypothetical protein